MSGTAAGPTFSWNLVTDLRAMLQFEFMRNAFEAGTIIAIVAGLVGYFVVLRRSSFASHALSHTGFSGAAAAVLIGASPVYGLLAFTMASGSGIALLGKRASTRDVETGTVLAFALALGLLFLSLYQGYATEAYSILFGEVLGISTAAVLFTLWTSLAVFAIVALIYRPLLLSSLDEDVAEAGGLPMMFLNLAFMLLLAVTISIAVQVIGVFLIFALMVTPAAIAVRLTHRALTAVIVSILVAVTATWAGLFVAWYEPYPVSFFIVAIVFAEYVCVRGVVVLRETDFLQPLPAPEPDGVKGLRNAALTATASQALLIAGLFLLAEVLIAHPSAAWNPAVLSADAHASILVLVAAAGVAMISFLLSISGFRTLAAAAREFTNLALLALVGVLGIALSLGGFGLLLLGTLSSSSSDALAPVATLFGVPVLCVGVLLALVGVIGQASGSWRVGLRYGERPLRAGALLMCIPVAGNAVAFFGYRHALARRGPSNPANIAAV